MNYFFQALGSFGSVATAGSDKNNSVGHHSKITIIFLSSLKNYNQVINFYGDKKIWFLQ